MTEEQEVAANLIVDVVLAKAVENILEEAADRVLSEPEPSSAPSFEPYFTEQSSSSEQPLLETVETVAPVLQKEEIVAARAISEQDQANEAADENFLSQRPSSSTQLVDEQAVGIAGKELAVITPNSPELYIDIDRTLPDIIEGLSYLSGTITNIYTTRRVQGIDTDLFKYKVLKQLTGITKNINDLFSSLSTVQKAETKSSNKMDVLSKILDLVNDNLVVKIESFCTELSSKIDSISTQIGVALQYLKISPKLLLVLML